MTIYFVVDEDRFYGVFADLDQANEKARELDAWVVPLEARKP